MTERGSNQEDEYEIQGLARNAAKVGIRNLASIRGEDETKLTRRVVEGWILNHEKQPEANVEITIRHQRRASATAPWEDVDSYPLGSLPAGKQVRLALNSSETLRLYEELRRLYELAEEGVPAGTRRRRYVDADLADILDGRERDALEAIIARSGDRFPELLGSIGGADLIALAAREREHGRRVAAVQEMEARISGGYRWTELRWKAFFEENRWIFGHGLDYRFLISVEDEAYYGAMEVSGQGAQRGDNLYRSEADVRFTVLVEIKRPDAVLVIQRPYRNGVYSPGTDLAGGVAQLQTNCRTWAVEGSTTKANQRRMDAEGTYTVEPKGILLIGQLGSLAEEAEWVEAFEQYRRNLHNPEILTYDELLARAKFIVETAAARAEEEAADRPVEVSPRTIGQAGRPTTTLR